MSHPGKFVIYVVIATSTAGAVTFVDSSFANVGWTAQKVDGFSTPSTSFSAGYLGSFDGRADVRQVNHSFGPADPVRSDIVSFHGLSAASYAPSIDGAIAEISFSFDVNSGFGGTSGGVGRTAALMQDGIVFVASTVSGVTLTGTGWNTFSAESLTSASFLSPALLNPDFTSSGSTILFGFVLSNGSSIGAPTNSQSYVDNFSLEVTPVPEPASTGIVLGALVLGLGGLRRFGSARS